MRAEPEYIDIILNMPLLLLPVVVIMLCAVCSSGRSISMPPTIRDNVRHCHRSYLRHPMFRAGKLLINVVKHGVESVEKRFIW